MMRGNHICKKKLKKAHFGIGFILPFRNFDSKAEKKRESLSWSTQRNEIAKKNLSALAYRQKGSFTKKKKKEEMGNTDSSDNFREIARLRREVIQHQQQQQRQQHAQQQQQLQSQSSTSYSSPSRIVEALERRNRYRTAQDKHLANSIREERPTRYYPAPPIKGFVSLVNKETGKLNPFPYAEYPRRATVSMSPVVPAQWNSAWVALLVRCGVIAPFEERQREQDPLSTSVFVSFMIDVLQQHNIHNNNNDRTKPQQHSAAAAATSAAAMSTDPLAPPPPREDTATAAMTAATAQQSSPDTDGWIVVESSAANNDANKKPTLKADSPWPLEECGVCLQFSSVGLNCCVQCQNGVCSVCLLHIIKPPVFDVSNNGAMQNSVARKKMVAEEIAGMIKRFEKRMKMKAAAAAAATADRIGLEEVARGVSDAIDSVGDKVSEVGQAISGFFNRTKGSSDSASSARTGLTSTPGGADTALSREEQQLALAKGILELVSRIETLGMFNSSVSPPPQRRSNNNNQNDDDDHHDDRHHGHNADDERNGIVSTPPLSIHSWPVATSFGFDDCSEEDEVSLLENVSTAVLRSIAVESRGRCPFCNEQDTAWCYAGRKPRMLLLKELADLRGVDPRVLNVIAPIAAAAAATKNSNRCEKKTMRKQSTTAANGDDDDDGSNLVKNNSSFANESFSAALGGQSFGVDGGGTTATSAAAGRVWVAPTEAERNEYETCVALALSAVLASQIEDGAVGAAVAAQREEQIQQVLASASWAQRCSVCSCVNWNERKCRVCGAPRTTQTR